MHGLHSSYFLRNETRSLQSAVGDGRCPKYEVTAGWNSMDVAIIRVSVDCFYKCGGWLGGWGGGQREWFHSPSSITVRRLKLRGAVPPLSAAS